MRTIITILTVVFLSYPLGWAISKDCECPPSRSIKRTETMTVVNPDRALVGMTIDGDTGYVALSGTIAIGHAVVLWNDIGCLKSMGIKKINILILSPGGVAAAGFAYADFMEVAKSAGIHITTEASGMVASAAIPIFLSGEKRIAGRNTIFMLHPPAVQQLGFYNLQDLNAQQQMMDISIEYYKTFLREHTNLTEELIEESMNKTKWFTAEEAKAWGFVDTIR